MKGFVFSIDAVFALYLTLLGVSALFTVIEVSNQSNMASAELAHIARDTFNVQNARMVIPDDIRTPESDCATSMNVGTASSPIYSRIDPATGYEGLAPSSLRACVR